VRSFFFVSVTRLRFVQAARHHGCSIEPARGRQRIDDIPARDSCQPRRGSSMYVPLVWWLVPGVLWGRSEDEVVLFRHTHVDSSALDMARRPDDWVTQRPLDVVVVDVQGEVS